MAKYLVSIVIPVYKEKLSNSEKLSLLQCLKILKGHTFFLVYPEGLILDEYITLYPDFQKIAYCKEYFKSTKTYNKLLLSSNFYKSFKDYTYIFIYQLDGWIFKDELKYWCEKKFDYIGSPWLQNPIDSSRKLHHLIFNLLSLNKVGNGGVSLRRVSSHLFVTRIFYFVKKHISVNEDVFFSSFVPLILWNFRTPDKIEGLKFSFDQKPSEAFKLINNLPMACHAWEKNEIQFWGKYIDYDKL